jgi:hypothetical protein
MRSKPSRCRESTRTEREPAVGTAGPNGAVACGGVGEWTREQETVEGRPVNLERGRSEALRSSTALRLQSERAEGAAKGKRVATAACLSCA